jgi:hypothetical protein
LVASHWLVETYSLSYPTNLKKYYEEVKEISKGINSLEHLGLFKSLLEDHPWCYFIKVDDLDSWIELEDEVEKRELNQRQGVPFTSSRVFEFIEKYGKPPSPEGRSHLKYLLIALDVWAGLDVKLGEYYSELCNVGDLKGGFLYGLYLPVEGWNYAYFWMVESLSKWREIQIEHFKNYGRPENLTLGNQRWYKRLEF